MAMSHSNESKLARIVEVLSVKYPGIMLEVQTLSTHQEMASAPVYFMARMMSLVYVAVFMYPDIYTQIRDSIVDRNYSI